MGTSKQEVSSNPFATPVEERRATPALPRKPLSLWIAQVVVGSQAPLGVQARKRWARAYFDPGSQR